MKKGDRVLYVLQQGKEVRRIPSMVTSVTPKRVTIIDDVYKLRRSVHPRNVEVPVKHESLGWVEPDIIINGTRLSFPQALTMRVALTNYMLQMSDEEFADALGRDLAAGYKRCGLEIHELMLRNERHESATTAGGKSTRHPEGCHCETCNAHGG